MGALVKLDQKRRKRVLPTRIRITTKGNFVPLIQNVTNPQIVLPRLDINILRGVHISDEVEMGIASVQESDGDAAYRPVRLLLAQLMREETATPYQAKKYLEKHDSRFATVPEMIGYIQSSSPRLSQTIVSLGTNLRDEFDHRQALAFEYSRPEGCGILYCVFAERIRPEWLLLIVAERAMRKS